MSREDLLENRSALGSALGTRIKDLSLGASFGELGLCRVGATRAASAVAAEENTTLLRISPEVFDLCLKSNHVRNDMQEKVRMLYGHAMFEHWKEEDVVRLAFAAHVETHRHGAVITCQGSPATHLRFITTGEVIVQRAARAPHSVQLGASALNSVTDGLSAITASASEPALLPRLVKPNGGGGGSNGSLHKTDMSVTAAATAARRAAVPIAMLRSADVIGGEEFLMREGSGSNGATHLYSSIANSNVSILRVAFEDITKLGFSSAHGQRTREMLNESLLLKRTWRKKYYKTARRGRAKLASQHAESMQAIVGGTELENFHPREKRRDHGCRREEPEPAVAVGNATSGGVWYVKPDKHRNSTRALPRLGGSLGLAAAARREERGSFDTTWGGDSSASTGGLDSARSLDSLSSFDFDEENGHRDWSSPSPELSASANSSSAATSRHAASLLAPLDAVDEAAASKLSSICPPPPPHPLGDSGSEYFPPSPLRSVPPSPLNRHSLASRCGWKTQLRERTLASTGGDGTSKFASASTGNNDELIRQLSEKLHGGDPYAFVL